MTLAPFAVDQRARAVRDETTSGGIGQGLARSTVIALTTVTAATGMLCYPMVGSADFVTSSPVFHVSELPALLEDFWSPAAPISGPALDEPASAVRSDQDELLWIKENSGLTWDQLGKIFGVSRRAVHMWASGSRMNEANAEVLRNFAAAVAVNRGGSPERTRAALLAHEGGFDSVVDSFRRAQVRRPGEALGAPFAPEERVENLRETGAAEA